MTKQIDLKQDGVEPVWVETACVQIEGERALQVTKTERLEEHDIDTIAKVKDVLFHNGVLEVDMLSRLLPEAPAYARGFIGIAFRILPDNTEFESFYLRPTNGKTEDPVRRKHGCQYFAYPGYTFDYFRRHAIEGFEAPAEIDLNCWMHLKAVIEDSRAAFYLDGSDTPLLCVDNLKHGGEARGQIGFFVDTGTEGYFKNLKVTCWD
jgi:hypothetical protein